MDMSVLAQIRALASQYPALAELLATPKRGPKRICLTSGPINTGKFPESGVNYAPRIDREPQPYRNRSERIADAIKYRASIDDCAEREGAAIERLERRSGAARGLLTMAIGWKTPDPRRYVNRFGGNGKGQCLSTWHYLRGLAKQSDNVDESTGRDISNPARGERGLILRRHSYRRGMAVMRWLEVCAWYDSVTRLGTESAAIDAGFRKPANRLPGWARQTPENDATRARRKLHRLHRDIVRIVGRAKIDGIPGAADLYRTLSRMSVAA